MLLLLLLLLHAPLLNLLPSADPPGGGAASRTRRARTSARGGLQRRLLLLRGLGLQQLADGIRHGHHFGVGLPSRRFACHVSSRLHHLLLPLVILLRVDSRLPRGLPPRGRAASRRAGSAAPWRRAAILARCRRRATGRAALQPRGGSPHLLELLHVTCDIKHVT